ncbi:MAG: hypothetical protein JNG84_02560 [Archangium sp.]|nr:hypothetical protein [Archangium sp.]
MKTPMWAAAMVAMACGGVSVSPEVSLPASTAVMLPFVRGPVFAVAPSSSGEVVLAHAGTSGVHVSRCAESCDDENAWRHVRVSSDSPVQSISVATSNSVTVVAWIDGAGVETAWCRGLCGASTSWRSGPWSTEEAQVIATAVSSDGGFRMLISGARGTSYIECSADNLCESLWLGPFRSASVTLHSEGTASSATLIVDGTLYTLECASGCTTDVAWAEVLLWPVTSPRVSAVSSGAARHVVFLDAARRLTVGSCDSNCGSPLSWVAIPLSSDSTLAATLEVSDGKLEVWQQGATRRHHWQCTQRRCRSLESVESVEGEAFDSVASVTERSGRRALLYGATSQRAWALHYDVR